MQWQVHQGDILDVPADVLICSANVYLTLSGGVGGALLLRYGPEMQQRLNAHLQTLGTRHVAPGEVVAVDGCSSPYLAVLHAVAVDAFYESTVESVAAVVSLALRRAAERSAATVRCRLWPRATAGSRFPSSVRRLPE